MESESTINDLDDLDEDDEDGYEDEHEDNGPAVEHNYDHGYVHPKISREPQWNMYVQYQHNKRDDVLIVTLLPKLTRDVVQLEKEVPDIFNPELPESSELAEEVQETRTRKESEKSTESEAYRHRRILPIFVFSVDRQVIRNRLNQSGKNTNELKPIVPINRCWNRPESATRSMFGEHSGFVKNTEEEKDPFRRYTDDKIDGIEQWYHRSFVRGVFRRLTDKIISARDFHIALSHCVPVEKEINITDAVKRIRVNNREPGEMFQDFFGKLSDICILQMFFRYLFFLSGRITTSGDY